jgi:hypothetical protein
MQAVSSRPQQKIDTTCFYRKLLPILGFLVGTKAIFTFPLRHVMTASPHDCASNPPSFKLLLRLDFLLGLTSQSISLGLNAFLSPLTGSLGLRALGVHLLLENPLTLLFGLGFVDLHEV